MKLSPAVLVWRSAHALIAVAMLAAIGVVWFSAITGSRGPRLRWAIGILVAEGVLVAANGGDCPLGPLGDRIGDEVPLFELVLSPTAAKRAVPVLGAIAAAGIAGVAVRGGETA